MKYSVIAVRLSVCAKGFLACPGSPTKSSLPSSSTSPLPLARSFVVFALVICRYALKMYVIQSPDSNLYPHPIVICHVGSYKVLSATFIHIPFALSQVKYTLLISNCQMLFQAFLTLLAWALPQWRQLQLLMAAMSLLLVTLHLNLPPFVCFKLSWSASVTQVLSWFFSPESPRWLFARGKRAEATALVRSTSKMRIAKPEPETWFKIKSKRQQNWSEINYSQLPNPNLNL